MYRTSFDSLCETPPDSEKPPLDRVDPGPDAVLNEATLHWREHGYLKVNAFAPDEAIKVYVSDSIKRGVAPMAGTNLALHS